MVAMRAYSEEEFERILLSRGCEKTDMNSRTGVYWRLPDHTLVHIPNQLEGRYGQWVLDDLISKHDLPQAPIS